jgi:GTPase
MFRVAIVGRPNVGKSTLFNRLCGSRRAIVGDEPGITRDRLYGTAEWLGRTFEVLDTGGLMPGVRDVIPAKILEQVETAIRESHLLLFVVDGRAGPTPADEQLLPILRRSGRQMWVVVNKVDSAGQEADTSPFYAFGAVEVFAVSAEHNRGIADLLDCIVPLVGDAVPTPAPRAEPEPDEIAVAVVGRPNVGKSSLVNRLLGTERAIVSEIPGTTRDSVDTLLVREGRRYRIIDTAGIRRKGRTEERTEKISVIVARKSLEAADVALLLLDAEEGVTKLDAAIGGYAEESGCSVIIVVNKWDKLAEKETHTVEEYTETIRRRMKYLSYAPVITVSALTGQRVSRLFDMVSRADDGRRTRVATGVLNNMFVPDLQSEWRPDHPNQTIDIRYITQVRGEPPTFILFNPSRKPLHFSTERFILNKLRERFGFYATPIRLRQRLKTPSRGGRRAGH